MKISDAGLDLIKSFEGYHEELPDGRCRAYLDTLAKPNIWTIGWGCTEGIKKGMIWTREQAEDALRNEVSRFEASVTRLVTVEINQNQFDALCSFAYNCGEDDLANSTLLKKLNKGDYEGAAKEFEKWVYAGGKKYTGLVRRRAAEKALFLKPVEVPEEPDTPKVAEQAPSSLPIVGGATGTGISLDWALNGPPEFLTTTVSSLTSWQGVLIATQGLVMFGRENWIWIVVAILTVFALNYWNRRTAQ